MKYVLVLALLFFSYGLGEYFGQKQSKCATLQLSTDAQFILESVENDTLIQSYILSPTYRERVREAVEEFDKKYQK